MPLVFSKNQALGLFYTQDQVDALITGGTAFNGQYADNVYFGSDLTVTGDLFVQGDINITGDMYFYLVQDLFVTGDVFVGNDLTVTGDIFAESNVSILGDLDVTGDMNIVIADVPDLTSLYSDTGHLHDDRYYTETEVDNLIAGVGGGAGIGTGDVNIGANLYVAEDLTVTGDMLVQGNMNITGDIDFYVQDLSVTGDVFVGNDLTVTGDIIGNYRQVGWYFDGADSDNTGDVVAWQVLGYDEGPYSLEDVHVDVRTAPSGNSEWEIEFCPISDLETGNLNWTSVFTSLPQVDTGDYTSDATGNAGHTFDAITLAENTRLRAYCSTAGAASYATVTLRVKGGAS